MDFPNKIVEARLKFIHDVKKFCVIESIRIKFSRNRGEGILHNPASVSSNFEKEANEDIIIEMIRQSEFLLRMIVAHDFEMLRQ